MVFSSKEWQNGMAERSIGLARLLLLQVVNKHHTLDFVELELAFLQVARILNRRPLTARKYNEDDYFPFAPYDLTLGGAEGIETRVSTVWEGLNEDLVKVL